MTPTWGWIIIQVETVTMQLPKHQYRGNYKSCVSQLLPHSGAEMRTATGVR